MKTKAFIFPVFFFVLCFASVNSIAQNTIRVGFYNVENLLDTINNPDTRDDEFTPQGMKRWTRGRYYSKIKNLSKILMSLAEWDRVGILGLAEVENRKVVEDLMRYSLLRNANYKIVHFESPDKRGIDVALLYDPKQFTLVEAKPLRVDMGGTRTTRDILYVKGLTTNRDTLKVFVNHWPSRWGGQINSEGRRVMVAQFLKDWLAKNTSKDDKVVILGDFNDTPGDKSISETLGARGVNDSTALVNLMYPYFENHSGGTHFHDGEWNVLDHVIVSRALLDPNSRLYYPSAQASIHKKDFMLIVKEGAEHVFRSYRGAHFEGGFSDHLPVYIDIEVR